MRVIPQTLVIALATSVTLSSSGCASRGPNVAAIGLGLAAAGVGVSIYAADRTAADEPDSVELDLNPGVGTALIVLGLAAVTGGVIGLTQPSRPSTGIQAPAHAPAAVTGDGVNFDNFGRLSGASRQWTPPPPGRL